MNVTDAVWHMVHYYPGGAPALAPRLLTVDHTTGLMRPMSPDSLQHKASPTYPRAHFSPEELTDAMEATGNLAPLHAIAARLRQMVFPMPSLDGVEGDLAPRLALACKNFGELVSEISTDGADGKFTPTEVRRIQKEAGELMADINSLLAYVTTVANAGKPRHGG